MRRGAEQMRTFLPAPSGFDAKAYTQEAASAVGLSIPGAELAEVALNLERTAGFAQLLAELPGLDDEEPAPVFRPREDAE